MATLETANAAEEQSQFLRFAEARKIQSYLFDKTNGSSPGTTTGYAQRLSGSTNERYGLGKSISVMPGDTIYAEVYAKYVDPINTNWTAALTTLMGYVASPGGAPAGTVIDRASYASSTATFPFPTAAAQNTANSSETGPKAYLNWLVFDRNFNFILNESGYKRLSNTPKETGQDVAHELLFSPQIAIKQPGFVYIYLSNEESSPLEVYFDDFKVEHIKSPVIQMDDYYPFGLTFNSYSRENSVTNNYLYNGKEKQDELDLGWLDYGARMYMPEIGRWGVADPKAELLEMSSPYVYSLNSPINFIDRDGELPIFINGRVSSDSERGDESYWDYQLLRTIASSGIPNPGGEIHYVDGDRGIKIEKSFHVKSDGYGEYIVKKSVYEGTSYSAGFRTQGGYLQGKKDFSAILSKLARDPKTGKITEKIQIYTHSRGAAFGAGYTEALLEMIKENANEFADPSNVIDFVYNMAPHQSSYITAPDGVDSYSQDHSRDKFSDNDMKGVKGAFTSGEKSSGIVGAHSTSSFVKDVGGFLKSFKETGGKDSKKQIRSFINRMQNEYGIKVTVK